MHLVTNILYRSVTVSEKVANIRIDEFVIKLDRVQMKYLLKKLQIEYAPKVKTEELREKLRKKLKQETGISSLRKAWGMINLSLLGLPTGILAEAAFPSENMKTLKIVWSYYQHYVTERFGIPLPSYNNCLLITTALFVCMGANAYTALSKDSNALVQKFLDEVKDALENRTPSAEKYKEMKEFCSSFSMENCDEHSCVVNKKDKCVPSDDIKVKFKVAKSPPPPPIPPPPTSPPPLPPPPTPPPPN